MTTNEARMTSGGFLQRIQFNRGFAFGVIIIGALIAFEIFNYSTTEYALSDLLGKLDFFGLRWATVLSIAFCGIDFAGIARLFTPEEGSNEPNEVWYLFGAWLLAATMNALLTWWGVSLALLNHESLGNAVISREVLLRIVPIFVSVLVWLIRVLIIGSFSVAGDRLFSQEDRLSYHRTDYSLPQPQASLPTRSLGSSRPLHQGVQMSTSGVFKPAPKQGAPADTGQSQSELSYHPVSSAPHTSRNQNSYQMSTYSSTKAKS